MNIGENKDFGHPEGQKTYNNDIVGDSITWGLNHCDSDETYTAHYAKMLSEKYPEAVVCRYDGITHDELLPMDSFEGPSDDLTGELANGRHADIKVFIDNLGADYLPKWDFALKDREDMPIDSSAAAIVASGILELAKYVSEDEAARCRDVSEKIM